MATDGKDRPKPGPIATFFAILICALAHLLRLQLMKRYAVVVLIMLMLSACGNGTNKSVEEHSVRDAITTTTTLSPGDCLGLIARVQAGSVDVSTQDYERLCGALPAGVVLSTTTTLAVPTTAAPVSNGAGSPASLGCGSLGSGKSVNGVNYICDSLGRWDVVTPAPLPKLPPPVVPPVTPAITAPPAPPPSQPPAASD